MTDLVAVLRSIVNDIPESCYHADVMEYDDGYPCPHCRLLALISDLERERAA
jgi:hypothetical protein